MKKHINIGLYLSNKSNKNYILQQIMANKFLQPYLDLSPLKGALHSSIAIDKFIEDELRHDRFLIQTDENSSLASMSSGQQKKALLLYLINQKPQYIVLDDVYSNVDKQTQQFIDNELTQLGESTLLVQLFFRKRDLLPCIDIVYSVNENNEITASQQANLFLASNQLDSINPALFSLPKMYNENHTNVDPLVQLNSVSVHYGTKDVLDNVQWTIKSGEFWQLVGPNGAGKSTLISMITGDNPRAYGQDMILFGRKKRIRRINMGYKTPDWLLHTFHD
jgi:molybdate transport system ATP-binding protein